MDDLLLLEIIILSSKMFVICCVINYQHWLHNLNTSPDAHKLLGSNLVDPYTVVSESSQRNYTCGKEDIQAHERLVLFELLCEIQIHTYRNLPYTPRHIKPDICA